MPENQETGAGVKLRLIEFKYTNVYILESEYCCHIPHGTEMTAICRLLQSGPAFFAQVPVDIRTKIFIARGTSPIEYRKRDKRSNDNNLQS